MNVKYKDKVLNETYNYFRTLITKHCDDKTKTTDILLAASDISLYKNMKVCSYKVKKVDYITLLNDAVDIIIDHSMEDDVKLTIEQCLRLEQMLRRSKEILIEEKGGIEY